MELGFLNCQVLVPILKANILGLWITQILGPEDAELSAHGTNS